MTWFRKEAQTSAATSPSDGSTAHPALKLLIETLDGGEGWTEYRSAEEAWWYPGALGHRFYVLAEDEGEATLCLDVILFKNVLQSEKMYEDLNTINADAGCWWVWHDPATSQIMLSSHASLNKVPVFSRVKGVIWSVEASYAAEAIVAEWTGKFSAQAARANHPHRGPRSNRDGWLRNAPTAAAREGTSALPVVVTEAERALLVAAASAMAPATHFSSTAEHVLQGSVAGRTQLVVSPRWHETAGYGLQAVVAAGSGTLRDVAALNRELAQPAQRLGRGFGAGGYVLTAAGVCFTTFATHFALENWSSNDIGSAIASWSGVPRLGTSTSSVPDANECFDALQSAAKGGVLALGDETGCRSNEPLLSLVLIHNLIPLVLSYGLSRQEPDVWTIVEHAHHFSRHTRNTLLEGTIDQLHEKLSHIVADRFSERGLPLPCAAYAPSAEGEEALLQIARRTKPGILSTHIDSHVVAGAFPSALVERLDVRDAQLLPYLDDFDVAVPDLADAQRWAALVSAASTVQATTLHLRVVIEGSKLEPAGTDAAATAAAVQDLQLRRLVRKVAIGPNDLGYPDPISWEEVVQVAVAPLLVFADSVTFSNERADLTFGPLSMTVRVEQRLQEDESIIRVTSEVTLATTTGDQSHQQITAGLQQHCGAGALRVVDQALQSYMAVRLTPTGRFVLQTFAGWIITQLDEAAHLWNLLTANESVRQAASVAVLSTPLPVESFSTAVYGPPMSGKWLPERWRSIRNSATEALREKGIMRGYENYEVTYFCETIPDLAMELDNTPRSQFFRRHGPGLVLRARILPPAGQTLSEDVIESLCSSFNDLLCSSTAHVFSGFSPMGCAEYGLSMIAYLPSYAIGPEWYADEMLGGCVGNIVYAHLAAVHVVVETSATLL